MLSRCASSELHAMNQRCLETLVTSEPLDSFLLRVLVMETCPDWRDHGGDYGLPGVEVVVPDEAFNYNRFLNIALARTHAAWVAICNNDLWFEQGWLSAIIDAHRAHPELRSFSPIDPEKPIESADLHRDVVRGYVVRRHLAGWCIVTERSVLEEVGGFDEQFDFYFQDDDHSMTLRRHSIGHALVPSSRVHHLGGKSTTRDLTWEERSGPARKRFHAKWGSQRSIAWRHRLAVPLDALRLKGVVRGLFPIR